MASDDWFRKTTWSEADQADFWKRFARVRTSRNKAQYLRIQALHIQSEYPRASLSLLDLLVAEHPDRVHLAQSHLQRGQILLAVGEIDSALAAFRSACLHEKAFPQVRTQAWSAYGLAVVKYRKIELYDEVEEIVRHDTGLVIFPAQRYYAYAILALICQYRDHQAEAISHARAALEAAGMEFSGLVRHPDMGLVENPDEDILERLKRLVVKSVPE